MNQVTKKEEGALAVNMFEADANQGAQNIDARRSCLTFSESFGTTISRSK